MMKAKMSDNIKDCVRNMLKRGTIEEYDDSGGYQTLRLKGLGGETLGRNQSGKPAITHLQPFGLSAAAPLGSEGLILSLGGNSENAMFIGAGDTGSRPKNTAAGETLLYDAYGNKINLGAKSGIFCPGKPYTIKVGTLVIEADSVVIKSNRVDLGGEGGQAVKTAGGDSSVVFARL
jgi:phage gp45-like